jgi:uncharacterized membrane protein YkoI
MKKNLLLATLLSVALVPVAYADKHGGKYDDLGSCVAAALQVHPGKVTAVRGEIEDGVTQYELDIEGKDGKNWEAECDAKTGKILETEAEVSGNDPAFISKAKVSLDVALKTALAKYPGSVLKTEYELEGDGASYEFDIITKDGKMIEVEVNAIDGTLGAPEEVLYDIGN